MTAETDRLRAEIARLTIIHWGQPSNSLAVRISTLEQRLAEAERKQEPRK